jgi:hypothetical protein
VVINSTFDSSITSQPNALAIETAIESALGFYFGEFENNNIIFTVDFKYGALPSNDISSNIGNLYSEPYSSVEAALKTQTSSQDDLQAYSTLPGSDPLGGIHSGDLLVAEGEALNLALPVSSSNLVYSDGTSYDDIVTISTGYNWNFNPYDRNIPDTYDAIGAIEHELSEQLMGRFGAVGMFGGGFDDLEQNLDGWYTPLDLWRYSSPGVRDTAVGPATNGYFSINGSSLLQQYNNPYYGGDASDWVGTLQGDSYGSGGLGVAGYVSPVDLREDNILGWARTPAVSDFNGDYTSDIFWQLSNGVIGDWQMSNAQISAAPSFGLATGYSIIGAGNFTGSATSGILWENNGTVGEWLMSNGVINSTEVLGRTSLDLVTIGDFTDNGTDDIFWQNPATGTIGEWLMSNGNIYSAPSLGNASGYQIIGAGYFTGSFNDDILWEHNGAIGEWDLDSNGQIFSAPSLGGTTSTILGIGNFTGYGSDDILWKNGTTVGEWIMQNGLIADAITLGNISPAWQFVGVGDFTSNGVDDVLWRDSSSGAMSEWLMQGGQIVQAISPGSVASSYHLVAHE